MAEPERTATTGDLQARVESAELKTGELVVQCFRADARYRVPPVVRLVTNAPASDAPWLTKRPEERCGQSTHCSDCGNQQRSFDLSRLGTDVFPRLEWSEIWRPILVQDLDQSGQPVDLPDPGPPPGWVPCLSPPVRGCLDAFIRLCDATPAHVKAFAATWGVLGICRHGVPFTHDPWCRPLGLVDAPLENGRCWEPIKFWYAFIHQARTMLSIAAKLQFGELAAEAELAVITRPKVTQLMALQEFWYPQGNEPLESLEFQRQLLTGQLAYWFELAGLHPGLSWSKGDIAPRATLVPYTPILDEPYGFLFGVLAAQLGATIMSATGLYRCDGCGYPYSPSKRRARADRRRYCLSCSEGASLAAKRRWKRDNYVSRRPS